MLFTSSVFWTFYLTVLIFLQFNYKAIKSVRLQNILLLSASYFFYGYWDWRFLGLIFIVSAQTYIAAFLINQNKKFCKLFLSLSIIINLMVLLYFKYANFFVSEFLDAFNIKTSYSLEYIILPVGISFYIFQSFTYLIDVYFKKIKPEQDPIKYFAFISFFPQLVAGPIERASSLLPQFHSLRGIDSKNIYDGTKIIIIGLFLKIFVADSMIPLIDPIFSNYKENNGGTLFLAAMGFSIQIYGDFAGYSLIAIGVAKIMGFSLMKNFNTPYFSTSIQDFWRRWHISLSSFFRDYVYIPLGGSRKTKFLTNRNLLVTFTVSGLWHGANWTFIFWGFIHGILLIFQRSLPLNIDKILGWFTTIVFVILLWILFRSNTIYDFYSFVIIMISNPGFPEIGRGIFVIAFYYLILDLILLNYTEKGSTWFDSDWIETLLLSIMFVCVIGTIPDKTQNFIYFQF